MSWVNNGDHHRADVFDRKGLGLIDPFNANRCHWVASEIVGTHSILNTTEVVTQANVTIDDSLDWVIPPVGLDKRVCSFLEDYLFPLYECLFKRLRICLPFSYFEVYVMNI